MALLDIRNLSIDISTAQGKVRVIDKFSLTIVDGSIHALIGESGSGKTLIAKAILGLHNDSWTVTADRLFLGKIDLTKLSNRERRKIMGEDIAMIFQHPRSYLDPSKKILIQMKEILTGISLKNKFFDLFKSRKKQSSMPRIKELLHRVGIQNDTEILNSYPHDLSEGVCQKLMIAMAIANNPRLLIADEPVTAMESVTQSQILRLLYKLNQLNNTTILLMSNNFSHIGDFADYISLIYCGQMVESGSYKQIISTAMHPYTEAMIKTVLHFEEGLNHKSLLYTLPGNIPSSNQLPIGCRLGPRCPRAQRECVQKPRSSHFKGHIVRCHFPTLNENKSKNDNTSPS
ncbi:ABC oligopeptide/dipeptide transporter ATP-binding protein [Psychromonas sp. CNPT3]|uniref:oligopeptide/dipeptide ABC transporter ATP-binding protein n=1 Tax=Psychromonas sp. CNPT3 TaxID=314282 RepID=UPI00006E4819|nr:oligopeptide/dipeptide ABC transporter ATP-binding protein [Psychromonas sp. CNPT3]AGH81264.1 ABC oligopeptide/dipeptide transporter ATP-binding protein [Psychromonas sp. CNPT3]